MQSVESQQNQSKQSSFANALTWSRLGMFAIIIILIVAIIFAANQNDIIGWLVVAIAAGWLILAIITLIWARKGAKALNQQAASLNANLAAQRTPQQGSGAAEGSTSTDPMLMTKLDHSFKIVEVQKRVILEEMQKGSETADQEMIERALDTIEMTASNARDMINPNRHAQKEKKGENGGGDAISGQVIN